MVMALRDEMFSELFKCVSCNEPYQITITLRKWVLEFKQEVQCACPETQFYCGI
jgi:hypothetical protein